MSETGSPVKKIKRASIVMDENQGRSSKKCSREALRKTIIELKDSIEQRDKVMTGQMKLLLEAYAEQKVFLAKLLRQQNDGLHVNDKFPVKSVEQLKELDTEITLENKHIYVKAMKSILQPSGVGKNLRYILSTNVTMEYNIEGVHGKRSFKQLENFYSALIESIPITAKSPGPPEEQLRKAVQLQKKREFKANCLSKRNQSKLLIKDSE